jgi:hypothetical protein
MDTVKWNRIGDWLVSGTGLGIWKAMGAEGDGKGEGAAPQGVVERDGEGWNWVAGSEWFNWRDGMPVESDPTREETWFRVEVQLGLGELERVWVYIRGRSIGVEGKAGETDWSQPLGNASNRFYEGMERVRGALEGGEVFRERERGDKSRDAEKLAKRVWSIRVRKSDKTGTLRGFLTGKAALKGWGPWAETQWKGEGSGKPTGLALLADAINSGTDSTGSESTELIEFTRSMTERAARIGPGRRIWLDYLKRIGLWQKKPWTTEVSENEFWTISNRNRGQLNGSKGWYEGEGVTRSVSLGKGMEADSGEWMEGQSRIVAIRDSLLIEGEWTGDELAITETIRIPEAVFNAYRSEEVIRTLGIGVTLGEPFDEFLKGIDEWIGIAKGWGADMKGLDPKDRDALKSEWQLDWKEWYATHRIRIRNGLHTMHVAWETMQGGGSKEWDRFRAEWEGVLKTANRWGAFALAKSEPELKRYMESEWIRESGLGIGSDPDWEEAARPEWEGVSPLDRLALNPEGLPFASIQVVRYSDGMQLVANYTYTLVGEGKEMEIWDWTLPNTGTGMAGVKRGSTTRRERTRAIWETIQSVSQMYESGRVSESDAPKVEALNRLQQFDILDVIGIPHPDTGFAANYWLYYVYQGRYSVLRLITELKRLAMAGGAAVAGVNEFQVGKHINEQLAQLGIDINLQRFSTLVSVNRASGLLEPTDTEEEDGTTEGMPTWTFTSKLTEVMLPVIRNRFGNRQLINGFRQSFMNLFSARNVLAIASPEDPSGWRAVLEGWGLDPDAPGTREGLHAWFRAVAQRLPKFLSAMNAAFNADITDVTQLLGVVDETAETEYPILPLEWSFAASGSGEGATLHATVSLLQDGILDRLQVAVTQMGAKGPQTQRVSMMQRLGDTVSAAYLNDDRDGVPIAELIQSVNRSSDTKAQDLAWAQAQNAAGGKIQGYLTNQRGTRDKAAGQYERGSITDNAITQSVLKINQKLRKLRPVMEFPYEVRSIKSGVWALRSPSESERIPLTSTPKWKTHFITITPLKSREELNWEAPPLRFDTQEPIDSETESGRMQKTDMQLQSTEELLIRAFVDWGQSNPESIESVTYSVPDGVKNRKSRPKPGAYTPHSGYRIRTPDGVSDTVKLLDKDLGI